MIDDADSGMYREAVPAVMIFRKISARFGFNHQFLFLQREAGIKDNPSNKQEGKAGLTTGTLV